jgi:DNA-binding response OmpR family regulator
MGNYRVLIVDDDPDIRSIVRGILEPEGFEVSEARDGGDALAQVTASPPNLILLDLMMPGMNGSQFLAATAALPRLSEVPVIIVTAFDDTIPQGERVLGVLNKPFNTHHLIAVVGAARRRFPEAVQRPPATTS